MDKDVIKTVAIGGVSVVAGLIGGSIVHAAISTHGEGFGVASMAVNAIRGNESNIQHWETLHGTRPATIVPMVRTPFPQAPGFTGDSRDANTLYALTCTAYMEAFGLPSAIDPRSGRQVTAGKLAACVIALVSNETDFGNKCYNFNPGNRKFARSVDSSTPCHCFTDRAGCFAFYPAFASWSAGMKDLLRLLRTDRYRAGVQMALDGDIQGFTLYIGENEYAPGYAQRPGTLKSVYHTMVSRGWIPAGLVTE